MKLSTLFFLFIKSFKQRNKPLKITSIILDFAVLKTAARLTSQNHGYLAVFANTSL